MLRTGEEAELRYLRASRFARLGLVLATLHFPLERGTKAVVARR